MRTLFLLLALSASAFGQCGILVVNPVTFNPDCTGPAGSGSGTVTSVGLTGTANQITITGTSPITTSGGWTVSIPSSFTFPGTVTNNLSIFAATTSAQLRGVLSDESGTGPALFAGGDIGAATGTSLGLSGGLATGGSTDTSCNDGTAGCIVQQQGTAPSALPTTGIQWLAPTSVTSHRRTHAGSISASGFSFWTYASSPVTQGTETFVAASGTGSVCLTVSCSMTTPALGTPSAAVLTNATGLPEGGLSTTDITTNNASTSKHGFTPKYPNDATKYLDGTGAYTVPAGGSGGGVITYSAPSLTLTAGTRYAPPGGGGTPSTTEADSQVKAPSAATITNFQVTASVAPGTGNSYAFTWMKAGSAQSLTCTIADTATTCQDVTHSFTVALNDLVDVKIVSSGTIVTTPMISWLAQFGTTGSNGTVNSGTANYLAYYGATGTAVSPTSTDFQFDGSHTMTWGSAAILSMAGKINIGSDATGDIFYRDASGFFKRLAIGGATTVVHGGTIPAYSALVDADIPVAITRTVANGTSALGTSAISANACASVVTTSATNTATTDTITWAPNADISGVTGYGVATTDGLKVYPYPTSNNVNWKVCNGTGSSITPGAVTLNWRVVR